MAKVSVVTIANLDNPNTVVSAINQNFAALQAQIDLLLSRDGESPNTVLANLDMNNFRVINLPEPISDTEPARHGDIQQYVDEATEQADRAEEEADRAETEADRSETEANVSEAAADEAEESLQELQALWRGSLASDPALDVNDPDTYPNGAFYFNSTLNQLRFLVKDNIIVGSDEVVAGSFGVVQWYWFGYPSAYLRTLADVSAGAIVDGQFLEWNSGTETFLPQTLSADIVSFDDTLTVINGATVQEAIEDIGERTSIGAYDISFWMEGLMENDERLFRLIASRTFWLPEDLTDSQCEAAVAANASTVLRIRKNDIQIGTVTFAASGTVGTFSFADEITFVPGDVLDIMAPASADTALRDVAMTLAARR